MEGAGVLEIKPRAPIGRESHARLLEGLSLAEEPASIVIKGCGQNCGVFSEVHLWCVGVWGVTSGFGG